MGYKLLTQNMKTRVGYENETDWSDVGQWHEASGIGGLCTEGMIHDYDDPWIAAVMNPAHAKIKNPIMYETEREGAVVTDGLKCGCRRMRLIKCIALPNVPLVQVVAFGIYAALEVYDNPEFVVWARNWLSGKDRTEAAAARVARAARAVYADAAGDVALDAFAASEAAEAAYAAAGAGAVAARAARDYAAAAARAARVAAVHEDAAYAALVARDARVYAADVARDAAETIKDWQAIKSKAMQIK